MWVEGGDLPLHYCKGLTLVLHSSVGIRRNKYNNKVRYIQ